MTPEPLDLLLNFAQGNGELIVGIDHPAVAAFRRTIREGHPTGTWRYLVVYEPPNPKHTVLGAFVRTARGRVLFFPGTSLAIETDDPTASFNGQVLDHITADPPTKPKLVSHVAVRGLPGNKSRGINWTSPPPPFHMDPWFSLLVPDLTGFPDLPARLVVRFSPPGGDVQAFARRLIADGGVEALALPAPPSSGGTYFQLDVWLGRGPDWRTLAVRPLAWAYKPEIVEGPPAVKQEVPVNRIDVDFGSQTGVSLLVTRPAGHLPRPRILRPTLSR